MNFIIDYLKRPFYNEQHYRNKNKWFLLFTFLNIFINGTAVFFIGSTGEKSENIFNKFSFVEQLIILGILFPVIEELVYRYPLNLKIKSINTVFFLTIPISIIGIFTLNLFFGVLILMVVFLYLLFRIKIVHIVIKNQKKLFAYFFYGLSMLFALSHIGNHVDESILTTIFLTLLTFLSSILFSITRVLIGFRYSIFSHIIYNCFFIGLNFLSPILFCFYTFIF